MPTYDYQCRECGATIEVIHSMLEEGPTTCEQCGGSLRRVFYPTGIIFKGSGFYSTDSRSSSSSSSSSGGSKQEPAGTPASTSGESSGSTSSSSSSPSTSDSSSGSSPAPSSTSSDAA